MEMEGIATVSARRGRQRRVRVANLFIEFLVSYMPGIITGTSCFMRIQITLFSYVRSCERELYFFSFFLAIFLIINYFISRIIFLTFITLIITYISLA